MIAGWQWDDGNGDHEKADATTLHAGKADANGRAAMADAASLHAEETDAIRVKGTENADLQPQSTHPSQAPRR